MVPQRRRALSIHHFRAATLVIAIVLTLVLHVQDALTGAAASPSASATCSPSVEQALRRRSVAGLQSPNVTSVPFLLQPSSHGSHGSVGALGLGQPAALITSATTSYADSHPARAANVELAARRLDGAVVLPGQSFSLLRRVGPLSTASGYQLAFGIVVQNGEPQTVNSVAGGSSQIAATLYQAVFWAGYEVLERAPHSYWIDRYVHQPTEMLGVEATIDQSGLDFRFHNGGPDVLTIRAIADGEQLTIALLGIPPTWSTSIVDYRVVALEPAPGGLVRRQEHGLRPGQQFVVAEPSCGFTVKLAREVVGKNGLRRILHADSHYAPAQGVVVEPGKAW